jgi:predicted lipoprotein with Yx(FWY)xxD motif
MAAMAATTAVAAAATMATATLLSGCSGWAGKSQAKPDPYLIGALPAADVVAKGKAVGHWVKDGNARLVFTGLVAPGAAAELTAALTPKTTTVVATVTGGDLAEGLAIGRTLHDRKLGLTIKGACVGPCADYWFPAATASRTAISGSWLGYVPDLSETPSATPEARAAEAKLYTDSGLDPVRFHTTLDLQLREVPGEPTPPPVAFWMPDKADLVGLGYQETALTGVWLPPNLASANAQARAWGDVVAYKNTLVGLPPAPSAAPAAPVPQAPPAASTGH